MADPAFSTFLKAELLAIREQGLFMEATRPGA